MISQKSSSVRTFFYILFVFLARRPCHIEEIIAVSFDGPQLGIPRYVASA